MFKQYFTPVKNNSKIPVHNYILKHRAKKIIVNYIAD